MSSYKFDVVVLGTGASGYSAACRIAEHGKKSVCIVTEGVLDGTSRNTGSDKQTYYKLGLGGKTPDSVHKMAQTLFDGGAVDGDLALSEAALSARCFFSLCEAGVPFPHNEYGEYIGYKTDHDPMARATSAGPLTSKLMTEALQKRAERLHIEVFDGLLGIEILKNRDSVCGLLCIDIQNGDLVSFNCASLVLATGGPAGIYEDTVYPASQHGSSGLALAVGVSLCNMTEWQYGLASLSPRWNVSGTYMQVLPRLISIDSGGCEYEFLSEHFQDEYTALSALFLKGYQWPFDVNKIKNGSSIIDLLVYRETVLRGRKVYLDFTKNPFGLNSIEFEKLSDEAFDYLKKANACFGTPIARLLHMNAPAVELYRSRGVDISLEYLQIALCAQHNNGGISVDLNRQTELPGLFAIGECAGTHGITRPGGSALNAGQVGALCAAQYISSSERKPLSDGEFASILSRAIEHHIAIRENASLNSPNADDLLLKIKNEMSACASAIRNAERMRAHQEVCEELLRNFHKVGIASRKDLRTLYHLYDVLLTQIAVLKAMTDYSERKTGSRGSALYTDHSGDLSQGLEEIFRYSLPVDGKHKKIIQQISFSDGMLKVNWRPVRPLPRVDDCFENVWRQYRKSTGDL